MIQHFTRVAILSLAFSQYIEAQGLLIRSGAHFVVNNNAQMVINNGGFSNSGTFTAGSGTVKFTGTADNTITTIDGSSNTSFNNLTVDKAAGALKLARNIAVDNTVTFTSNNIELNGFDLDLGTTGSFSGENPNSRISANGGGNVLRTVTLNTPVNAFDPGNIGVEITTNENLGLTTVKRGHVEQVGNGGHSIHRFCEITPANNNALNATVKFHYFDAELNGITESELELWSSGDNGSTWGLVGVDNLDMTNNFVQKNGINKLLRFTLASTSHNPLPIQTLSLTGQWVNNNAVLKWITSETQAKYFSIEKSADGRYFSNLATIQGKQNNSNDIVSYEYSDMQPFAGMNYYRLKQVSANGSAVYSKIITLNRTSSYNNNLINVYPTVTTGIVHIACTSNNASAANILVYNEAGKMVSSKSASLVKGFNYLEQNLSTLSNGTYYIKIAGFNGEPFKVIKN